MLTVAQFERKRKSLGTAFQVAERAGIEKHRYAMFDGGQPYRRLSIEEAKRVADILGFPYTHIVDEKGNPKIIR